MFAIWFLGLERLVEISESLGDYFGFVLKVFALPAAESIADSNHPVGTEFKFVSIFLHLFSGWQSFITK